MGTVAPLEEMQGSWVMYDASMIICFLFFGFNDEKLHDKKRPDTRVYDVKFLNDVTLFDDTIWTFMILILLVQGFTK